MPAATLYVDMMSQPSRACAIVCDLSGLLLGGGADKKNGAGSGIGGGGDVQSPTVVGLRTLRLDQGEHESPEHRRINPLGKVPFLALEGAADRRGIPESGAIIAFLAAAHPDRSSLRAGAVRVVFHRVIGRLAFKQPVSADVAAHGAQVLRAALVDLQEAWLEGGRRAFIGGGEGDVDGGSPGTADLICLCELDQLALLDAADPGGGPCLADFVPPGSVLEAWRDRVRAACGGERGAYGRATRTLQAAAARFERMRGAGEGGAGSKL